jgi:hypothetical protein
MISFDASEAAPQSHFVPTSDRRRTPPLFGPGVISVNPIPCSCSTRTLLRVSPAALRAARVLLRPSGRPAGFGSLQNNLLHRTQNILSALPKMHSLALGGGTSHRFAWCVPVAFREMGPKEISEMATTSVTTARQNNYTRSFMETASK